MNMTNRMRALALVAGALLVGTVTLADDESDLVALDKEWGEATAPEALEGLLSDDIISIAAEGVVGKAEMLEEAATTPPSGPYMAGNYRTKFLGEDIAVMVHNTSGDDEHWSLHVWQRIDGNWLVMATATVPVSE
jgi:hypothetical protein